MSDHISQADAIVALRSFGRRFSEVLVGPPDDDAWERLIRASGDGLSAFDEVRQAVATMRSLTSLCVALPGEQAPIVAMAVLPSENLTTADLITEVRAASAAAGEALETRSDDDDDRSVMLNDVRVSFSHYISSTVTALAAGVRQAERAIENAR
jgi:hypothetical protein